MTNDNPKVSIITYVYVSQGNGRAPLLKEALDSVAAQHYPSYEHIVVDDGSEVDLTELVAAFPFTRLIKKPGTGIVSSTDTFNMGHQLARGEYCILLPSDDVQFDGAIEGMASALDANPDSDMAIGRALYERSSGPAKLWTPDPEAVASKMGEANYINGCAAMWRRTSTILANLPPNFTGFCSDYDLFATLSVMTRVIYPPVDVVRYREVPDSTRKSTRSGLNISPRRGDRLFYQYTKAARISFVKMRLERRKSGAIQTAFTGRATFSLAQDYSRPALFALVEKRQWDRAFAMLMDTSASFRQTVGNLGAAENSVAELAGPLHLATLVLMQNFRATHLFEPWVDEPRDSWYFEFFAIPAISQIRDRDGQPNTALTSYLGL